MEKSKMPLLLLDNASMARVVNAGEFMVSQMTFEEAKAVIEMYDEDDIVRCFTGSDLKEVFFKYLDIHGYHIKYEPVSDMQVGQDAIVFKLYIEPSKTEPVIHAPEKDEKFEAKKIQNVYVHCQSIQRVK